MEEKELKEFDLEDIIKEFGGTPLEKTEEKAPERAEPAEEQQAATQETVPVEPEEEQQAATQETVPVEPEEQQAETQETVPVEPEHEQQAVTQETVRLFPPKKKQADRKTVRMEPITAEAPKKKVTDETVCLERTADKNMEQSPAAPEEQQPWQPAEPPRSEPFSARWEPEYEQPMGEYVPPQPIAFRPKSKTHEMRRKLIEGPEKRFAELSEKGMGRLQVAIFLSLLVVLISAASTAMYAMGMVQENRMRLMVFVQFMALLVSALLSSFQMIEGVADLLKKRFTLNTLLTVTFLACCVDGILCLQQVRVPCCAAFSLVATMSLWSASHRRNTEMAQLDTMRKAPRLSGLAAGPDYMDGRKGLLRTEGQVEDFMDNYAAPGKPEKQLGIYGLIAMCAAFALGILAGVLQSRAGGTDGFSAAVQVTAVTLLAAVPATAFISQSRPAWILERRLHKLGTVLCGWQGVEGLCGKQIFPLQYEDVCPSDAVRLNGIKFYGSRDPDQVLAYAVSLIAASGSGLTEMFSQVLDSHNGRHYDAYHLRRYENGGVGGVVQGETVLVGTAAFMKSVGIEVPHTNKLNFAVYVVVENELSGLFAVSYEKTQPVTAGLSTLMAYRKLRCVLTSSDFMLTRGFFWNKLGIKSKRLLLPDYEVREQLRQIEPAEDAPALLISTARGLAPIAYGLTGARALRQTCRTGVALHIAGGLVGLGLMLLLVLLGHLELLTPANMFLYQLVWALPALLVTEWVRSI